MTDQSAGNGKQGKIILASQIFTPAAPIQGAKLFAGRQKQLFTLYGVLGQRGQHAILFGERGVGKTSIANVLAESWSGINPGSISTFRTNCAADQTFEGLWRTIFRRMHESVQEHEITPDRVVEVLDARDDYPLIILDELDRFENDPGLTALADTIKALSDQAVATTVVLVGVAGSITQLIGDHRSIERCLVQVPMPRMSLGELSQIVETGLTMLGMTIDDDALRIIIRLSQGLPSYTHLLSRQASIRATQDDRTAITADDISAVIRELVRDGSFSPLNTYNKATSSPREKHYFVEVLLACALIQKDELGYFSPKSVKEPLERILTKKVHISSYTSHLSSFAQESRGFILEETGEKRKKRYRFVDPMMQPFILMRALNSGLISVDEVLPQSEDTQPEIPDSL